jgi:hypothetical protein
LIVAVGRNDLCPCGSGKKYKKCHGAEHCRRERGNRLTGDENLVRHGYAAAWLSVWEVQEVRRGTGRATGLEPATSSLVR